MKRRSAAGPPSDEDAGLSKRYLALCEKYETAVRKLRATSAERAGVYKLAWWALRTSSSGLALVSGREIVVQNSRWVQLGGGADWQEGWRAVGAPERAYRSLRDLTLAVAAELAAAKELQSVARFERSDGRVTIEVRTEREAAPGGPLLAVMIHDITKVVQGERELERSRELLEQQGRLHAVGEMASGVAHDLNNTLHALRMRLEIVRADPGTSAAQRDDLDAAGRIVVDAVERVRLLQDFARRRKDLPHSSIDLKQIVDEAIELAGHELTGSPGRGAGVRVQVAMPRLPRALGSASEMRHVFVNLLLNARDAMAPHGHGRGGGTVRIAGRVGKSGLVVTVSDEGRGIAEADRPHLFEPFFTTKHGSGSGLGLSMAYGVMSRSGGSIEAANRAGGGATFTLRFRRAPPGMEPAARESPVAVARLRVLIVDDDQANLEGLQAVLRLSGHAVELARNGAEALASARREPPYDLVLCDLGMPGMDGFQVAAALRALEPAPATYLVTGLAHEIAEDDPRCSWVKGVLPKPLDLQCLREILASVASARRSG